LPWIRLVAALPDASKIPALAGPWFLAFAADVKINPAMTPGGFNLKHRVHAGAAWVFPEPLVNCLS